MRSAVHVCSNRIPRHEAPVDVDFQPHTSKFAAMVCNAVCASCRFCCAVLYLSSRMEVCCSSCASVDSIWLTCDCVALICDWFGAGPGNVVDVVAPALATVATDSNVPSTATTMVTLRKGARLRTVLRPFTASTAHQRNGYMVAKEACPRFCPVAVRVRVTFTIRPIDQSALPP